MFFTILGLRQSPPLEARSKAFLIWDNWNDYSFLTLFWLTYVDDEGKNHDLGTVKIGYFGQVEHERLLKIDESFELLDDRFFSLGQNDSYYENLNKIGEEVRDKILLGLKDIARNSELYEKAVEEQVTKNSLLRTVSQTSVTGQFRRLSIGGSRLSSYDFTFMLPKHRRDSPQCNLDFHVQPDSFPPTNIHVLIGRNGVGKTRLLNNMIETLIETEGISEEITKSGTFSSAEISKGEKLFANLISVTFSAFDESEPKPEKKDKTTGIQYSYIGLKQIRTKGEPLSPKSPTILKNEFVKSVISCRIGAKLISWKKALETLETDPNFKEAEIASIADIKDSEEFIKTSSALFSSLSSGHKIVLLTITRLVETIEERSLVLIDEPEAHLHPPLLSAFIRVLSDLLIHKNGVAIIATHSPVILQEVPKSCAWKIRRNGNLSVVDRLERESFGENVDTITREVFGLEVTNSGFHKLLKDSVNDLHNYELVLNQFNGQLGMEARSIVRALLQNNNIIEG
jgi:predicted ATPase